MDCKAEQLVPAWQVTKSVDKYGKVSFSHLVLVKSLEKNKAREVGERAVIRMKEMGEKMLKANRHAELEVKDRAEESCREVIFKISNYNSL